MVNFKYKFSIPHIVHRYIATLSDFNVYYDDEGLDFFVGEQTKLEADLPSPYYVFSIGGSYFTKRCPTQKVIEIIKAINKPSVLIGGKEEKLAGEEISRETGALNLCGKTTIEQSALIIKEANFVISNDTGMMHIAAALKKPVITLWGNTVPEFGMSSLMPGYFKPPPLNVEVKDLKCRPCSKLGFNRCPRNHFRCMNEIKIESIINYINNNFLI